MASGRKRIALIVPSSNTVMENDLHRALSKERYTVHTDRMYLVDTTREAEQQMIGKFARPAASDLGTAKPDLIVFGCTSAGSLFGLAYDAEFCAGLGQLAGCPALGVINAASQALGKAQSRRVALITPYIEDLTASVAKALTSHGREIVAAHGMGISLNFELAEPEPADVVAFARDKLHGMTFDTLFVSCTNFRAFEAKKLLEDAFGVRVITSNSAVVDAIEDMFGL